MFTGSINLNCKTYPNKNEITINVSNYKNFGTIISFDFPLSSYGGTRSRSYSFKIDGYKYISNIKVGVHVYQLDDFIDIYLNNKHILRKDRGGCTNTPTDCVLNSTDYYTIPASNLNLSSNDLTFRVDHYNGPGADGICTGAWFSFEIFYE